MNKPKFQNTFLLYDGHCFLCSRSAKIIRRIDKNKKIGFLPLQSAEAHTILTKQHFSLKSLDTVLVLHRNQLFKKSEAVFEVFRILGGGWKLLLFFRVLPLRFRDKIYDFIARNRYRWFGRKEHCEL